MDTYKEKVKENSLDLAYSWNIKERLWLQVWTTFVSEKRISSGQLSLPIRLSLPNVLLLKYKDRYAYGEVSLSYVVALLKACTFSLSNTIQAKRNDNKIDLQLLNCSLQYTY